MTTVASRGASASSSTFGSTTNAYDGSVGTNPATYSTWTSTVRRAAATITITGYSFSGIASNYVINSVTANVRHLETVTSAIATLSVQLLDSTGTAIGSAVNLTTLSSSAASETVTLPTPTAAQVVAGLQISYTVTRANSISASTVELDQIDLTVDYTPPAKVETFTDAFTTQDTTKWTWGTSCSVVSGRMQISNAGTDSTRQLTSTGPYYTLIGSSVYVEAVQMMDGTLSQTSLYFLATAASSWASIWFNGNNGHLVFEEIVSSSSNGQVSITYNATQHRWWRIRESGGSLYFDTSPDGTTWTQQNSVTASNDYSAGNVRLAVTTSGTSTNPTIFDNLNVPPPAKVETLTDDFTTKDTTKWNWRVTAGVSGGKATYVASGDNFYSNISYDLTGSYALAACEPIIGGSSSWHAFRFHGTDPASPTANFFAITQNDAASTNTLVFTETIANAADPSPVTITYNSINHKWWRIRESGGTVYWETSPDASTWTVQRSKTPGFAITAMWPRFMMSGISVTTMPTVDNFNLPAVTTNTGQFFSMAMNW